MRPPPTVDFSKYERATRVVGRNICVQLDHHFYSVVFRHIEVFSSGFCVVEVEDGQSGFGDVGDGAGA